MPTLKWLIAILLAVPMLLGCGDAEQNPSEMWARVLDSPPPSSVSNIRYHKDRNVMHGAMVLRFYANQSDLQSILASQNLPRTTVVPDAIFYTGDELINKDIDWWKPSDELKRMLIYGAIFDPPGGIGDWQARYIFIDQWTGNVFIFSTYRGHWSNFGAGMTMRPNPSSNMAAGDIAGHSSYAKRRDCP